MSNLDSDWGDSYQALSADYGSILLADWTNLELTGSDRHKFLNNLCTNDIQQLPAGKGCEAFVTDVKGKIVSHVFVFAGENSLELLAVPGQAAQLVEHLDRYLIREDVGINDQTEQFHWLLLSGAKCEECIGNVIPECRDELQQAWSVRECRVSERNCLIARVDFLWTTGFLVGVRAEDLSEVLAALGPVVQVAEASPAWTAIRLESQLPLFNIDFDSSHLPQEVNRDLQAVNFRKGCYLGQETVARIDALGHVNKKVVLLQFEGEAVPAVGTVLTGDGKQIGAVTSSVWSPQFQSPLGLACVRRGWNDQGSQLSSEFGMATVVAPCRPK